MKNIFKHIWTNWILAALKWIVRFRNWSVADFHYKRNGVDGIESRLEIRLYLFQRERYELGFTFDHSETPLFCINIIVIHIEFEFYQKDIPFWKYENICFGENCVDAPIDQDGVIIDYCEMCPNKRKHKVVKSHDGKGPDTIVYDSNS